jgi:hypothetical protein
MKNQINEIKRMQQLAGILNENNMSSNSTMEGLDLFLEILGYNSLSEAENSKTDILSKVGQKGAAFFGALNSVYNQVNPEVQSALEDAIKDIATNNMSPEEVKKELGVGTVKEAEDESESTDPKSKLGRLRKFLNKTVPGNITKAIMGILIGTALMGPVVKNFVSSLDSGTVKTVTQSTNLDRDTGIGLKNYKSADDVGIKVGGQSLKAADSEPNTVVDFAQFKYGKGKQLSPQGETEIDNLVKSVEKVIEKNPDAKVNISVTGTVSKTTGTPLKGTDTKDNLDAARGETVKNILQQKFGDNPNIKIKTEPNPSNAYKSQFKVKAGGEQGAGAVIKVNADIKNQPVPKDPAKLIPTFNPEYAEFDAGIPKDKAEKPIDKGAEEESAPTSEDDIKNKVYAASKLNRNGQIATVLAIINSKLNIATALGQKTITSYPDSFLSGTEGEAKTIANLIINIRKNPDSLLKKVSSALDIKLEPRARAIATKPAANTQAQRQAIKEDQIKLFSLLQEALVDQVLSDDDIRKNKKLILSLLGTMYASAGNNQLSVVPKDTAEQEELVGLGFSPQPGGNYVFLQPGQTKATATAASEYDTLQSKNKTQPDVANVGKSLQSRTTYKSLLKRIDTTNEFSELVLNIFNQVDPNFANEKNKVKSTLFSLRNRIKLKEEEKDVTSIVSAILKDGTFSNLLKKINTNEEAIQLILRDIIPYLNPSLNKGDNLYKLKNAIIGAANTYSKQQANPTK